MLSACFFMLTEAQTVHLEQIIKPTWPLEMTSAIKLLYSSNSPIIVTSTFTIIKMMIRIGHFYYYCITVWVLVITAFVNCPSLCLSCPFAFIFSLKKCLHSSPSCPPSVPASLPRHFSHQACSLRWHKGHSSDTRLLMIGHCVGTNSEFIRDRWGNGVCACICVCWCHAGGGFRQADHQSHTNIPTHPLNKNNTV